MSHVFPRQHRNNLTTAVSSAGCYIIDENGKRYLDASGGAAVSCLGHGDPDVIAAVQSQVEKMAFAHTGFFTSDPAEQLAELLVQHAPDRFCRSCAAQPPISMNRCSKPGHHRANGDRKSLRPIAKGA